MESKRKLVRGPLQPPRQNPFSTSDTQARASKDEISVRRGKEKEIEVVEFASQQTPQPFLDPSIIQRRIQLERQWKIDEEKKAKQESQSTSSL